MTKYLTALLLLITPASGITLSEKCALASRLIRDNNCGEYDCDYGLFKAEEAGCRIQHWGHTPDPIPRKKKQ
jgi:hypothetical protein